MCATNPDEYRFRCPEGHTTIWKHTRAPKGKKGTDPEPSYYCNTCKKRYEGKPVDLLEVKE